MIGSSEKTAVFPTRTVEKTHGTFWLPVLWARQELARVTNDGQTCGDMRYSMLTGALNEIEAGTWKLNNHCWVTLPLIYTQLVTIGMIN